MIPHVIAQIEDNTFIELFLGKAIKFAHEMYFSAAVSHIKLRLLINYHQLRAQKPVFVKDAHIIVKAISYVEQGFVSFEFAIFLYLVVPYFG